MGYEKRDNDSDYFNIHSDLVLYLPTLQN